MCTFIQGGIGSLEFRGLGSEILFQRRDNQMDKKMGNRMNTTHSYPKP